MQESSPNSEPARQILEVARNELHFLLEQKDEISRKVKVVKRAVEGLISLFGEAPGLKVQVPTLSSNHRLIHKSMNDPISNHVARKFRAAHPDALDTSTHQRVQATRLPSGFAVVSHFCKPKLERACRIALLESESPATAAEIYDRIARRGSYQLNRYKHPLRIVIAVLKVLVSHGDAIELIESNSSRWQWRIRDKEILGIPETFQIQSRTLDHD